MDFFAGMNTTALLAGLGGLGAVLAIGLGARAAFGKRKSAVIERLERATSGGEMFESQLERDRPQKTFAGLANFLRPFAKLVKPTGGDDLSRLNRSLINAGYRTENAVEIFLGIKFLLPIVVIIILWQIDSHLEKPFELPPAISICFIGIAIAFFLPNLWLKSKIGERQQLIGEALPDSMDLLVTCVEAGLSLDAAMARVSQELELVAPVLAQEIKQTLLEIQAGVRRADAFHRLSQRTGVEDLRTLSAMIIQTEMFGTSVSRALRVHAEGMRTKRMQKAEEKAAMVSTKMTVPLILCILPSLFAVVIGPAIVMVAKRFAAN